MLENINFTSVSSQGRSASRELIVINCFNFLSLNSSWFYEVGSDGAVILHIEANNFWLGKRENPESFEGMKMRSDEL